MILTCPSCATQYAVKDGAIPPQGRQVRCASCKHAWHQYPESTDAAAAAPAGADPAPSQETQATHADGNWQHDELQEHGEQSAFAEPPGYAPVRPAPADPQAPPAYSAAPPTYSPAPPVDPVAPPAYAAAPPVDPVAPPVDPLAPPGEALVEDTPAASMEWTPPAERARVEQAPLYDGPLPTQPAYDDDFTAFTLDEHDEPRERSRLLTVLMIAALIAALAAAFWFLAPLEWKERVGIAAAGGTPLQLMMTHSDRQKLASGNELLAVSGRVINPTDESHNVPPIRAQLRSSSGKLVYSWTIAPPARSLPPGASATFNSAEVNVPSGGDELTITLGSAKT